MNITQSAGTLHCNMQGEREYCGECSIVTFERVWGWVQIYMESGQGSEPIML